MNEKPAFADSPYDGDRPPGLNLGATESFWHGLQSYLIGFGLAMALTAASFWAVSTHVIYGPGVPAALVALAIAQMGIHLVFFLHITTGPDNTNNLLALLFGVFIVFLVVLGSLWIMANLNHNMMPTDMARIQMQM
ncbi:MAG TPA: cytochrome o ubiquinol oxidase subunit IV [Bradyrhizobium sp.]|nr:cytochrome o ubiquinol oxidase subunit IV [Bradyrhizobium sp.]